MIFLDFCSFWVAKSAVFSIFCVFRFVHNLCDFSVFFVSQKNLPLWHKLTSPLISMTKRSTPWAAGCWGPKFTTRLEMSLLAGSSWSVDEVKNMYDFFYQMWYHPQSREQVTFWNFVITVRGIRSALILYQSQVYTLPSFWDMTIYAYKTVSLEMWFWETSF